MNEEELQELDKVIKSINRKAGKDFIEKGSQAFLPEKIPTGSLGLDIALNGGWPMGRSCLLWGLKGGTKSTLALATVGEAQKKGKVCLYIDAEGTFTADWAEAHGVDASKMYTVKAKTIEYILENIKDIVSMVDVIVVDSVSIIFSDKYFQEDNGQMGQQARATKELISKLSEWNPKALLLIISQGTTKIANTYTEVTPTGGLFLQHAVSINVKLTAAKKDRIMESVQLGNQTLEFPSGVGVEWFLEKNKTGYDKLRGRYRWTHSGGIDWISEVVDLAVTYGVVDKRGSWLYLTEDSKFQGESALISHLHENEDLAVKLKDEILGKALH